MLGGRRLVCKYVYRYCIVLVDSFLFFLFSFPLWRRGGVALLAGCACTVLYCTTGMAVTFL